MEEEAADKDKPESGKVATSPQAEAKRDIAVFGELILHYTLLYSLNCCWSGRLRSNVYRTPSALTSFNLLPYIRRLRPKVPPQIRDQQNRRRANPSPKTGE